MTAPSRSHCVSWIAAAQLFVFAVGAARAQPVEPARVESGAQPSATGSGPEAAELPPVVPRPDWMSRKPVLPDILLKDKRTGRYVTGFPAVGWDDEKGFNLGAMAEFFNNGAKDDPYFRSTPYRSKTSLAAVFSTEGVSRVFGALDAPYLFDSPYRLRVAGGVVINPINNYFGVGEDSLEALNFPGAPGRAFEQFDDYQDALDQQSGGLTYANYNVWGSKEYPLAVLVERDLFGGIIRPLVGVRFQYTEVDDYTGERVEADGGKAVQQPTKLFEDQQAGLIDGVDGGWDNFIKIGLSLDTRDFEPDPTAGVLAQISSDLATNAIGSQFNYQRVTASATGYYSPFPEPTRLVLAGRGVYSMSFGEVPFFALSSLSYNTLNKDGLGGFDTLRGFKRNRFIGESAVMLGAEVRWSFSEWDFWGQHLKPMLVPFLDAGRVHDDVELKLYDWEVSYGAGFRLAWNLATVVSFDVGVSEEDTIFYMELGHSF